MFLTNVQYCLVFTIEINDFALAYVCVFYIIGNAVRHGFQQPLDSFQQPGETLWETLWETLRETLWETLRENLWVLLWMGVVATTGY